MNSVVTSKTLQKIRDGYPDELWMLLQLLVAPDDEVPALWQGWTERFTVDGSDWRTKRQFSRVWIRLKRCGIEDAEALKLQQRFGKNRQRVQKFFSELLQVKEMFADDPVPMMLLKSVSLVLLGYEELGARTMYDLDVLVPYTQADRVYHQLEKAGWSFMHDHVQELPDKEFEHAIDLAHPRGGRLDLHWNLMRECLSAKQDLEYWQRARCLDYDEQQYYVLEASDLFLHICIHGYQRIAQRYDWAVDCHVLLAHEGSKIDWSEVIQRARARHVLRRLQICVAFLHTECRIEFPKEFFDELFNTPFTLADHLEYYVEREGMSTFVGNFPVRVADFIRFFQDKHWYTLPYAFLRFMQFHWETRSGAETLGRIGTTFFQIQKRRVQQSKSSLK